MEGTDGLVEIRGSLVNSRGASVGNRGKPQDALFGFWGSNLVASFVPDFAYNSLIVSKDPVAADYIGTGILNQERAKRNRPPRKVPVLQRAAKMGLGTNDPEKIELCVMDLDSGGKEEKQQVEKEAGKAVEPGGSYTTQREGIKTHVSENRPGLELAG